MLVTGARLLEVANRENFAVPAYNTSSWSMFHALLRACEEDGTPYMVAVHPLDFAHMDIDVIQGYIAAANRSALPMALHLDHGLSFEQAMTAIHCGFTSVMIDASALPFAENLAITRKVAEAAHSSGVSVEAELGTIGQMEFMSNEGNETILYTKPKDAARFVEETGCDSLAVSIGTSHGLYPAGVKPRLRLDLLAEIKAAVCIPLVLHGGSGNPDEEVRQACLSGVNKVNIASDFKIAYYRRMRQVLNEGAEGLREPWDIEPACEAALAEVVHHKNELFNALGRQSLYHDDVPTKLWTAGSANPDPIDGQGTIAA
jgi:fructose-bisphosphate aldolase class II